MSQVKSKNKVPVSTVITAFLLITIPVVMGLLVCVPAFGQWMLASKGDILKGALIGLSILPIFLFITIKGGTVWYKRWWTWGVVTLAMAVLVLVVIFGKGGVTAPMGGGVSTPQSPGNMMGKGVPLG
ncbi:MAG: hypothetical protein ACRCW2_04870 [Cellulosilyticaceae bacterium]